MYETISYFRCLPFHSARQRFFCFLYFLFFFFLYIHFVGLLFRSSNVRDHKSRLKIKSICLIGRRQLIRSIAIALDSRNLSKKALHNQSNGIRISKHGSDQRRSLRSAPLYPGHGRFLFLFLLQRVFAEICQFRFRHESWKCNLITKLNQPNQTNSRQRGNEIAISK